MKHDNISWPIGDGVMASRIRGYDWAATPLGPVEKWPPRQRAVVELMLDNPTPMATGWGSELTIIHNDAFRSLLGEQREALARPFLEVWAEARAIIAPQISQVLAGNPQCLKADSFMLLREEGAREAVFDHSFSPLRDENGAIVGVLSTAIEVTDRSLAERHHLLVDSWAQAVWETNAEGIVTADSPSWREYTGQALEEWLGYGWLDAVHPDDRDFAGRQWRESVAARRRVDAEFRLRAPDGGWRWTNVRAAPVLDGAGEVEKWVGMNIDIDDRKRTEAEVLRLQDAIAQAQIREQKERLRQFGEASHDILWIRDAQSMQWQYLTPAFEAICGLDRNEALRGDNYKSWLKLVVPEDREHVEEKMRRVRGGEHATFEYRIRRPADGEIRWLRDTDFPIANTVGEISLIGGIGHDITTARLQQERLETSEERLRNAAEVGKLGLWDWDVRTGEIHWSDEHFRMEGYKVGEVVPSYETWAARLHPDDRIETENALRDARDKRKEYIHEFRTLHPNGTVRWLSARGRFFYDQDGEPIRMVGALIDTTDQRALVAELQHRTRNLLGVVRVTAQRTGEASKNITEFRRRFDDRLGALTRVQALLSRLNDTDRIAFDELVSAEILAMDGGTERVTLDGPSGIRLRSSTVQMLAMALHELATNAIKYGALGQPNGHLEITWRMIRSQGAREPELHIDWRERGVIMPPPDSPPQGGGQGRELIEAALPYQLDAATSFELGPDGVHCTITIPVSETNTMEPVDG